MILCGGSCGGRFSRPVLGTTCYENRILQADEHTYFWPDCIFCIKNNIYLIVNIDTYKTNSRWTPTNIELRNFVIETKNKLKELGATKLNCRFTVDNESDEYCDFEYYMNMVRVIHDALNGEFLLGAGNFRTPRKDWYEHLAEQYIGGHYEIFDFHMQDGLDSPDDIKLFCDWILYLKNTYKMKIAVTEGNNFWDVSTAQGNSLLKWQIGCAEDIGASEFCWVYANWMNNGIVSDSDMSYNYNFHLVSEYWDDMLSFIQSKKPTSIINKEFGDMELKVLKVGMAGNQVKWLQKVLDQEYGFENSGGYDGKFGTLTRDQVKEYQTSNGLAVDGVIGKDTTFDLIWNAKELGKDYWFKKLQIYVAFE